MSNTITRDEIMSRATMAPWEPGTVTYDMEVSPEFPTGSDCSAYVTWCWGVTGDFNTETLVSSGLMYEIPINDLQRGDATGHCGPGTSGADGHIQLFDGWLNDDPNDNHYYCWQQNGVGLGPHRDLEDWPSNYKAYRYRGLDESAPAQQPEPESQPEPQATQDEVATLHRPWPSYMPRDEWFGDYSGPEASHGGAQGYEHERPDIKAFQQRLVDLGFDPGPIDGIFGPRTIAATSAWQQRDWAATTEFFGQVWIDDWYHIFTF